MAETYQRLRQGDEIAPGQWTATACGDVIDAKAIVACRRCGELDALDDEYEIAPDGRVTPRWWCPSKACGEQSWLLLGDYTP